MSYNKKDGHYFLHGGFWLLFAQSSTIATSLASTVVLAHYLTTDDFGIYRYLISVGVFLGGFCLTGIGQGIFQAAARGYTIFYKQAYQTTVLYNLIPSSFAGIGFFYYYWQNNLTLAIGCILIAVLQPISIHFLNTIAFLQGQRKFKQSTVVQTLKSLFVTSSTVGGVLITQNILVLFGIYLGSQALFGYLSWRWSNNQMVDASLENLTLSEYYLSIAKHTTIRNIILGIATRVDSIFVFQYLGATSLAIFTIATILPDQIKGSFKNLTTLLIPNYAKQEILPLHHPQLAKRTFQFFIVLCCISIVTIITIPYIYPLLFPKYTDAILYTQLLALGFPASAYLIKQSWQQARADESALYFQNITMSLFQLISVIIGIIGFGLMGAIISRIATQYFSMIVAYVTFFRKNK